MSEPTARQIAERFYTHLPAYRRDSLAEAIEQRVATLTADLAQARQEDQHLKALIAQQATDAATHHIALAEALQARDAALAALVTEREMTQDKLPPSAAVDAARTALLEAAEEAEAAFGRMVAAWLRSRAGDAK